MDIYRILFRVALAFSAIAAVPGVSNADYLEFDLVNVTAQSSATPPGSPNFAKVAFSSTTPGTVTMTITNLMPYSTSSNTNAFLSDILLNVAAGVTNLTVSSFSAPSETGPLAGPPLTEITVSVGSNSFGATPNDHAGLFDISFDPAKNQFFGGSTLTFTITDTLDNITASSFSAMSSLANTNGPQTSVYAAAKVQGFGSSAVVYANSAVTTEPGVIPAIVTPLPSSMAMALSIVPCLGAFWYRRRNAGVAT